MLVNEAVTGRRIEGERDGRSALGEFSIDERVRQVERRTTLLIAAQSTEISEERAASVARQVTDWFLEELLPQSL
jgi:hypothetical protein